MIARAMRMIAAALAVLVVSLAITAGSVSAHSSEASTAPADGEILATAPSRVEVLFDSPLLDVGAALVVRDASGASVSIGTPRIERQRISVAVDPAAPPGEYSVAYRVVAEDGHALESSFGYTVGGDTQPSADGSARADGSSPASAPAASEPASEPSSGSASGPPLLLIAGGVLVLLLAGAGAIALRR